MNSLSKLAVGETQELDLPLGFRFHPTEFELYNYYLIPELKGEPLPTNLIVSLDVYRYDPWQLPLDQLKYAREKEGYFFTQSIEPGTSARATPSGNWIISKENIPICRENEVIGFKNKFLFSNGKDPIDGDQIAYWKMVEYRCNPAVILTTNKEIYLELDPSEVSKMMDGSKNVAGESWAYPLNCHPKKLT